MWTFTAKDVEIELTGLNQFLGLPTDIDIETNNPKGVCEYSLEFETRSWGIKYIAVAVSHIVGEIVCEIQGEDLTFEEKEAIAALQYGATQMRRGEYEFTIPIDTRQPPFSEFKISNDGLKFFNDGRMQVDTIEINFSKKTIEVTNDFP